MAKKDRATRDDRIKAVGRLKQLRNEAGYSQEELANLLGYKSKTGYSMLETQGYGLDIFKAKQIADLYGKSIEEIFFN